MVAQFSTLSNDGCGTTAYLLTLRLLDLSALSETCWSDQGCGSECVMLLYTGLPIASIDGPPHGRKEKIK